MNRNQRRAAQKQSGELSLKAARLQQAGRLREAETLYRQVLAADPDHADSLHGLGTLAHQAGRPDQAAELIARAIAARPSVAGFHCNLGKALVAMGRLDEAAASYGRALGLRPDDATAGASLANVRIGQGRAGEAEVLFKAILGREPRHADSLHGLGMIAQSRGRRDDAIGLIARATEADPTVAVYHTNLGRALAELGRHGEAITAFRAAVALRPGEAANHVRVGNALLAQGQIEAALAAHETALALDPALPSAASNRLLCLNYSDRSAAEIFAEHRRWGLAQASLTQGPAPSRAPPARVDRDPDRRLRIGYVSADFRHHPVASFLAPLLAHHDHERFEVWCFSDVARPEAVTERFRSLADRWVGIAGAPDAAVADRIRAAAIDILIDLAGHTSGGRLGVFAREPAPVQVTWLGYPSTTGLPTIDWRLVDAVTDPPGEADALASERLERLDGGFLCYEPPADAPDPGPPPSVAKGHVTFGSFNFASKLSDRCLDAWARVLAAVPGARLMLKGGFVADEGTRARVLSRLAAGGIGAERVDLLGWTASHAEHLALYGNLDIALDPFPYNGATTTCEALWMGAPVVTLAGGAHAGRVGASLLTRVGLEALIADDVEAYVAIAVGLAG